MAKTTAIDLKDIRSVTDFQRNAKMHVTRLRKTKSPMVLTVNGGAAVVVQDAVAYQEMTDRLEQLEYERKFIAAVNEGIREADAGLGRPVREAFEDIKKRHAARR